MAMEFDLIPQGTLLQENGHGIWGSADGENWGTHPILKLPQQFYKGETRAVLELSLVPEVNFIRAGWDLNRWGRVAPTPMFVLGLHLAEVPAMPLRTAQTQFTATT
jgi:hypothetical protein